VIPARLGLFAGVGLLVAVSLHGTARAELLGPAGELVAGLLWAGLGFLCLPVAAAGVWACAALLVGASVPATGRVALGGLLALLGAALWLDLAMAPNAAYGLPPAGLLGALIVERALPVIGPLGTGLVATAAVLTGLLVSVDASIRLAWLQTARALQWVGRWVRGQVRVASEARAAARARRAELAAAKQADVEAKERVFAERLAELDARIEKRTRRRALEAAAREEARLQSEPPGSALPRDAADQAPEDVGDPGAPAEAEIIGAEADACAQGDGPSFDTDVDALRVAAEATEPEVEAPPPSAADVIAAIDRGLEVIDGPVILERRASDPRFDESPAVDAVPRSYELPPLHLLDYEGEDPEPVDQSALKASATRLEEKLKTYGVEGRVTAIRPGPVVTTYEYQPAPGVKVSKIANLADDIAMSMEAVRVRIVAPIPGRGVVGIELPNERRETVYLKELIAHDRFRSSKSLLTLSLGKDAEGDVQVRDLKKMPHLLVAGTTGSGKSVSINTMILSILYKATPDQVKFIMVDPKMLELSLYNDIPHLLLPVVTDAKKASMALQWTVDEMERRYQLLSDMKVRDIDGFNRKLDRLRDQRDAGSGELHDPFGEDELPESMPYLVVLIDEFADLMCVAPRDVEASVQRLAQKARAAGIHVLLATQRPSTDVITGVIKNNFPSRISFQVASRHDSATVLNTPGAENLLGMGDSLFVGVSSRLPERIHGGFVSEAEVERVVEFWKSQAKPKYDPTILQPRDDDGDGGFGSNRDDVDEHYDMAVRIVTETRRASISGLQRRLRVGYNRAARMIEMMEEEGIVGPASGPKGEREVLVKAVTE
jgi:S-DNA-T family DNA segregation ATPase FtsK/SpoIIIE